MNEPLVSIVMSTKDTEEQLLKQAIKSILNQSYKNFEFIIVCDGGKNDLHIIKEFKDNRIIILKHEASVGLTKSLNEMLKIAKGKYIARMDSDDISTKDRLKIQVDFLEKNKNIEVCSTFYKKIGKINRYMVTSSIKFEGIKSQMLFLNPIAHSTVMIRKEFLEKNSLLYDEEYVYSQDFELWTRSIQLGKFEIIPKLGLYYRIHDKQIGVAKKEKQNMLCNKILKANLERLQLSTKYMNVLQFLNGNVEDVTVEDLDKFIEDIRVNKIILEKYDSNVLVNSIINQWNIMSIKKKRIYMIRHIRFSLIFEFIYRIIYTIKLFTEDMYYTILGNVNIDSNIKE